jgi:hypothetical protein
MPTLVMTHTHISCLGMAVSRATCSYANNIFSALTIAHSSLLLRCAVAFGPCSWCCVASHLQRSVLATVIKVRRWPSTGSGVGANG